MMTNNGDQQFGSHMRISGGIFWNENVVRRSNYFKSRNMNKSSLL